jgi:hypothetical protein
MKLLLLLLLASAVSAQTPVSQFFAFGTIPDAANETTETRNIQLTDGRHPTNFTVQALPTGGPTTCTYKVQGTLSTSPASVAANLDLVNDGTAPADDSTVTIGSTVYTFKDTLTPTAFEVLVGADGNAALDNLIAAINGGAGSGTLYAAGTTAHPTVTASARATATTTVTANFGGQYGNLIATAATTSPDSHMDWEGAGVFLAGGLDADWVDLTAALSCLPANDERMHHIADKPVHLIRAYLISLAGGSSPTVPFRLLATTR